MGDDITFNVINIACVFQLLKQAYYIVYIQKNNKMKCCPTNVFKSNNSLNEKSMLNSLDKPEF